MQRLTGGSVLGALVGSLVGAIRGDCVGAIVDNSVGLKVARSTGFEVGLKPPTITDGSEIVCCVGVFVEDSVGLGVARLPGLAVGVTLSTIPGESEAIGCCAPGDCVGATMNPTKVSFRFPQTPLNETREGICEGKAVGLSVAGAGRGMTLGRLLGTAVGAIEYTKDGLVVVEPIGFSLATCWVSAKRPTIKCDTKFSWTGSCTAENAAVESVPQALVINNAPPGCSSEQHDEPTNARL